LLAVTLTDTLPTLEPLPELTVPEITPVEGPMLKPFGNPFAEKLKGPVPPAAAIVVL